MRILRVITRLNIGGPARQALMLTRDLRPRFDTDLVVGHPNEVEGELSDEAVHPIRVPLTRQISPLNDLRAFRFLRSKIRAGGITLVHSHMAKAGALARLATPRKGERPILIHTFHGHVLEGYFSSSVERAFLDVERRLARRTHALIAVSEEIKSSLLSLGVGEEHQYRVVPLGFDLAEFLAVSERSGVLRNRLGLDEGAVLLGCVGRLVPIKDHQTLLAAVQRLPEVHLALVGDGESRAELQAAVASLGLMDRVHFVGWWNGALSDVYADLDLAVLSSRNEGSPVALIEAHASGLAAVATDVGGVRSVVRDGVSGRLVPSQDPAALAEAIGDLLSDDGRRRAMGEAGRTYVSERFSKERLISDIRALYTELLGD